MTTDSDLLANASTVQSLPPPSDCHFMPNLSQDLVQTWMVSRPRTPVRLPPPAYGSTWPPLYWYPSATSWNASVAYSGVCNVVLQTACRISPGSQVPNVLILPPKSTVIRSLKWSLQEQGETNPIIRAHGSSCSATSLSFGGWQASINLSAGPGGVLEWIGLNIPRTSATLVV